MNTNRGLSLCAREKSHWWEKQYLSKFLTNSKGHVVNHYHGPVCVPSPKRFIPQAPKSSEPYEAIQRYHKNIRAVLLSGIAGASCAQGGKTPTPSTMISLHYWNAVVGLGPPLPGMTAQPARSRLAMTSIVYNTKKERHEGNMPSSVLNLCSTHTILVKKLRRD